MIEAKIRYLSNTTIEFYGRFLTKEDRELLSNLICEKTLKTFILPYENPDLPPLPEPIKPIDHKEWRDKLSLLQKNEKFKFLTEQLSLIVYKKYFDQYLKNE